MIYNLIKTGVILIPFYELIVRVFPNAGVAVQNTREAKEALGLWIALAIGLVGLYVGNIKSFDNKWVLIFLGYCLINLRFSPSHPLVINDVAVDNFQFWKPFLFFVIYTLMVAVIASVEFSQEQLDRLFKIMAWSGVIMAGYAILQRFGFEQFWIVKPYSEIGGVPSPNIVGNLGQPTLLAPFLGMLVPFALYLRKYWMAVVMTIAVIFTDSNFGLVAMIVGIATYSTVKRMNIYKTMLFICLSILILLILAYIYNIPFVMNHLTDSGKFETWGNILQDMRDSYDFTGIPQKFSITGLGLGSFAYLFHVKHSSIFFQAHNELLEIFYQLGIVGLVLMILSMCHLVVKALNTIYSGYVISENVKVLFSSFVCIALCSLGTFVWQLGVYQFYTALIIGLIYNQSQRENGNVKTFIISFMR